MGLRCFNTMTVRLPAFFILEKSYLNINKRKSKQLINNMQKMNYPTEVL
jgi:hypothetical protein